MHAILRVFMAVLAAVAASLTFSILRRVRTDERGIQVDLEFNTGTAARDFSLLFYGETMLFLGFMLYTAGNLLQMHQVIALGEATTILSFLAPLKVLSDWRRRLK